MGKKTDEEIASHFDLGLKTVCRVRQRFVEEGLESTICRKPRSRIKPNKVDGEREAHLIAICCSKPPEGRSRWTLKLLADKMVSMEIMENVSPATIGCSLKK